MLLDIDKIHTYYGKSHILYDVSMEVNDSATVALLGRNGVGKSTTLKSVIGIASPPGGLDSIQWDSVPRGWGTYMAYGMFTPGAVQALSAQRHMYDYGTTQDQLGAMAVAHRADAMMYKRPLTLEDW